MKTIEGLQFFEFILLILGVVLFLTLLALLIVYTVQKRSVKQLFLFFFLPVIMVGFPGIQKISFDNGVLNIERLNRQLAENPGDEEARVELEQTLQKFEKRPVSDPDTRTEMAEGFAHLGDTARAIQIIDEVIFENPEYIRAIETKERLNEPSIRIDRGPIDRFDRPIDNARRRELEREIVEIEEAGNNDQESISRLLESSAILKDTGRVIRYLREFEPQNEEEEQKKNNLTERFNRRR